MRLGTPSRAAHRATTDGGLVLLVRGIGSGGQHRPSPVPPRPRKPSGRRRAAPAPAIVEPQRAAQWLTQGLAGVIILGLVLMIGFMMTGSDRRPESSGDPVAPVTAEPLALGAVFPDEDDLRPVGATGAYRIEMRHLDADCRVATTGQLGALLARNGCSEVVRAGLTSPYGGYQVTAGVFTLADAESAATVNELVGDQVASGDGGFTTMPATGGDPATASVGWYARSNFLLYCVITRPDGALVHTDDPYAKRITAEIVDNHLGGVLSGRAAPPQPPGSLL